MSTSRVAEMEVWTASSMPRCRKAMPRRRPTLQLSTAMPRRSTVHSMEIFVFCFVLFFHCSEDLSIGLMRMLKVYEMVHTCL